MSPASRTRATSGRTRPLRRDRGSGTRCSAACTQSWSMSGSRWWLMCFWYQIGTPSGTGPSKALRRRAASRCRLRRSLHRARDDQPGVRPDSAAYSGSSLTAQSPRFSQARIIAVEMLRGPLHMARRRALTPDRMPRATADVALRRAPGTAPAAAATIGRGLAVADHAAVDRAHRHHAGEGAGDEGFVGAVDLGQAEVLLERRDARFAAQPAARCRG